MKTGENKKNKKKSKNNQNYYRVVIQWVIAILMIGLVVAIVISNQKSKENGKDGASTTEITVDKDTNIALTEENGDAGTDAGIEEPGDISTNESSILVNNEPTEEGIDVSTEARTDASTEEKTNEWTEMSTNEPTETPADEPADVPVHQTAEERAKQILSTMSMEEKVGQMFISRCPDGNGVSEAQKYHLGGYILFARDFENETQSSIKKTIASYQNAGKIGMLMGVDEEGGTVVRVSRYSQFRNERFDSPMHIYDAGGSSALAQDSKEKSQLLSTLGMNMNFAPVCDLPDTVDAFMYDRSFGLDVHVATEGVTTIVNQMNQDNMISVLKHFPGYGNNVDTHTGVAVDNRELEEFRKNDFLPFKAGIDAGAPCVMVSHNIINCMDASAPASLSYAVHEILRNELGFHGVIVTDDLSMDAITSFAGAGQAAILAVQAGNDLLCVSDYAAQVPAVVDAVRSGKISEERIDESVCRILEMKLNYGIIE